MIFTVYAKLKKINLCLNRVVGWCCRFLSARMYLLPWFLPCKLGSIWGTTETEEITAQFDPSENLQTASTLLSQVMKHQFLMLFYLLNQFCAFLCRAGPPTAALQLRDECFGVPERWMGSFSPVCLGSVWLHCSLLWYRICIWENT